MTYRRAAIVSFAIAAAAMLAMASKPHPRLTGPDGPEALAITGAGAPDLPPRPAWP